MDAAQFSTTHSVHSNEIAFWEAIDCSSQSVEGPFEDDDFQTRGSQLLQTVIENYLDTLINDAVNRPAQETFTQIKKDAQAIQSQCSHFKQHLVERAWCIADTWVMENHEGAIAYLNDRRGTSPSTAKLVQYIDRFMDQDQYSLGSHGAKLLRYSHQQLLTYALASSICIGILALWETMIGRASEDIQNVQNEQLNFYLIEDGSLWTDEHRQTAQILLTLPLECLPGVGGLIGELYGKVERCIAEAQRTIALPKLPI